MKSFYFILFLLLVNISSAQMLTVTGTNATGVSTAKANDYIVPVGPDGPLIFDTDTCDLGNFIPGLFGNNFGTVCFVHAKEWGALPQYHEVSSYVGARAFINGDNTSTIHIKWKNTGTNYATTDGHYAEIHTSLDFNVAMSVTGVSPGTPVTIYWWFNIFGSGVTSHEDNLLEEDSIFVTNSMEINGAPQFGSEFDFSSPNGLPGWNEWKNVTGTFKVDAGVDFNFAVSSDVSLYLQEPAGPGGFGFGVDQNNGNFIGEIYFTVVPQYPVPVNNTDDMLILFSLDIGSDTEFSDPKQDGNEFFDPGDLYAKSNIGPLPVVTPFADDVAIFGFDPPPTNSPPHSPAPVGSGQPADLVIPQYFDLDGTDMLSFSLIGMLPVPGEASITWFSDSCIFLPEYVFLSFDDDTPEHYTSVVPPSVPVNSNSPGMNLIYADTGNQDEMQEFNLDATPVAAYYFWHDIFSETDFHPNLSPNPLVYNDFDDDIDALDMIPFNNNQTPCTVWYFSADHEATYNHPSLPPPHRLDPGIIYMATVGGPVEVVTHLHHNLPPDTDINAFEFAWVWDDNEDRYGLAMIFSIDHDDTLTLPDESGGLNSNMLYYTFMNGSYAPFSSHQFNDNIDAIAIWSHSLNGTIANPNPVWGTKTWTGAVSDDWQDQFNWFPLGVPFDPEDVFVPFVIPSPVINSTGLDCKSIDISNGTGVELQPGVIFTIKGP